MSRYLGLLKAKRKHDFKRIFVATVAIFMLGFYFKTILVNLYYEQAYGTYNDPKQALNEVSKSLTMTSSYFNKGAAAVNYFNYLNTGISSLGYLNEVENATLIIFKKY